MPDFRIISIGTFDAHPLWNERAPMRTGHATTTLISSNDRHIVIDPGLPAQALAARMAERTPIAPGAVQQVFLTSFQIDHRRGLRLFDSPATQWLMHEPEIEAARSALGGLLQEAVDAGDDGLVQRYRAEIETLERIEPAPDALMTHADLFPLPGVTPGTCGVLLARPSQTVLICGDAVASLEHLEQGKVLPHCASLEQAQESFREAIEIADTLVPARDNVVSNPMRRV